MQRAERMGIPFWPAPSVLDTPLWIFEWRDIAAEAVATARSERQRIAAKRDAFAAQQGQHPIQRLG